MFTKCPDCGSTDIKLSANGAPSQSNSFLQKTMRKIEDIALKAKIRNGKPFFGKIIVTCNSCGKVRLVCVN